MVLTARPGALPLPGLWSPWACSRTVEELGLAGVGKITEYNAKDGSKQVTVLVGDLVRIVIEDQLVAPDTVPDTDVINGDAVSLVAVVKDGAKFAGYYSVDKKGSGKVQFNYTKKDSGQLVLVLYDFTVKSKTVGRALDFTGISGNVNTFVDSSTGLAPDGGVKVGDVIRLPVKGNAAGVTPFVAGGDSLKVVNVIEDNGSLTIYYLAAKVGAVNSIGYAFGPPAAPIQVNPN